MGACLERGVVARGHDLGLRGGSEHLVVHRRCRDRCARLNIGDAVVVVVTLKVLPQLAPIEHVDQLTTPTDTKDEQTTLGGLLIGRNLDLVTTLKEVRASQGGLTVEAWIDVSPTRQAQDVGLSHGPDDRVTTRLEHVDDVVKERTVGDKDLNQWDDPTLLPLQPPSEWSEPEEPQQEAEVAGGEGQQWSRGPYPLRETRLLRDHPGMDD